MDAQLTAQVLRPVTPGAVVMTGTTLEGKEILTNAEAEVVGTSDTSFDAPLPSAKLVAVSLVQSLEAFNAGTIKATPHTIWKGHGIFQDAEQFPKPVKANVPSR